MIFLRFILLLVLAYYLLKLFYRWILGSLGARREETGDGSSGPRGRNYSKLTDQEIEDADYEEIGTEES